MGSQRLSSLEESLGNAYPHKFEVSMTLAQFHDEFGQLEAGQRSNTLVSVAGKVMHKRLEPDSTCYVLESVVGKLPAFVDHARVPKLGAEIERGDIVGVSGFASACHGELGISVEKLCLLAPCLRTLPEREGDSHTEQESWRPGKARDPSAYVLSDQEERYRNRVLDLIVNPDIKSVFAARTEAVNYIRTYMETSGVTEVNTGVLEQRSVANGFKTHHNQLNLDMVLRVSSDQLLQLIVSNFFGVYEIGKQFRNEEMSRTHNPEFTTCEMYKAYADYKDLMEMTEKLLSGLVMKITGGYKVYYHSDGYDSPPVVIDFTPPFRRVEVVKGLEEALGLKFPEDLASEQANEFLRETCSSKGVSCPPPLSTANLLSSLAGHFLEATSVSPTFIVDYPKRSTPFAKTHSSTPVLAEHFKLFVSKSQLVSGFTQCRDPAEAQENSELHTLLEYGLPPCSGWACGIDRLVMLLTDSVDIKEVVLYPALKPAEDL
ncbi:lysine--tRNA ligase [Selaginella moellendorffii]|uniref:lysine--tRNA ligase n=1 Tax=Selaginella moellendorffii TaxID=88036 RepID=UPI000D1C3272|nr:lysine--tRNA ligase [Selaginella moellendorffii]|eukprot:XP_024519678.1 lysine--tRNA ligase [Selaginella moellendorffii]